MKWRTEIYKDNNLIALNTHKNYKEAEEHINIYTQIDRKKTEQLITKIIITKIKLIITKIK